MHLGIKGHGTARHYGRFGESEWRRVSGLICIERVDEMTTESASHAGGTSSYRVPKEACTAAQTS